MFKKKYRITKKKDFEKVLKSQDTKKINSKFINLFFLNNNLNYPRISVLAGVRTVSKKATERNRAKRRVREAIKQKFSIIKDKGVDILVFCKKNCITANFQDILEDVRSSLLRLVDLSKVEKNK